MFVCIVILVYVICSPSFLRFLIYYDSLCIDSKHDFVILRSIARMKVKGNLLGGGGVVKREVTLFGVNCSLFLLQPLDLTLMQVKNKFTCQVKAM